jgi:hypothetical protein
MSEILLPRRSNSRSFSGFMNCGDDEINSGMRRIENKVC